MKLAANIVGVILLLVGAALVVKGVGLASHGGALAAQFKWEGRGAVALAFGAGFLVWANRHRFAP